jgi:hypothetical protein
MIYVKKFLIMHLICMKFEHLLYTCVVHDAVFLAALGFISFWKYYVVLVITYSWLEILSVSIWK